MTLQAVYPGITRLMRRPNGIPRKIGDQIRFYGTAIAGVPFAAFRYRVEVIRLIAEISMGSGILAMIGGTVVIVGFLTLASGGTLAVQGFSSLGNIGIEALTGFLAAFINVRIVAPVVAGIGLAATFGAGVTAQLGSMRIAEEIDALEAMAIRSVPFLVSSRIVAGLPERLSRLGITSPSGLPVNWPGSSDKRCRQSRVSNASIRPHAHFKPCGSL